MNRVGIFLLLIGVFFLFIVTETFSAESSDTGTTVEDSEKVVETDDKAKTPSSEKGQAANKEKEIKKK